MKETHKQIELTDEELDETMMMACIHFESMRALMGCRCMRTNKKTIEKLECKDCQDLKIGVCEGEALKGWDCIMCMYVKAKTSESGEFGLDGQMS